jgi:hypothetical protein
LKLIFNIKKYKTIKWICVDLKKSTYTTLLKLIFNIKKYKTIKWKLIFNIKKYKTIKWICVDFFLIKKNQHILRY